MAQQYSEQVADGVRLIDVMHVKARGTCAYLIDGGGEHALIDCGGKKGAAQISNALEELQIAPEAVRWLIVTHAHLDHGGCAGEMMRRLPNATLAGHPSAVKHLSDPQLKLAAAARGLYGDEFFEREYGELLPIEQSRVRPLADGEEITMPGINLRAIYTPGHAWHHLSIMHEAAGIMYAGDAYGVSYCKDKNDDSVVLQVTPPTQFNPEALLNSVRLMHESPAKHFALSHFGLIPNTPSSAEQQYRCIEEWSALAEKVGEQTTPQNFHAEFEKHLRETVREDLIKRGLKEEQINRYAGDMRLTACGFEFLRERRARKAAQ